MRFGRCPTVGKGKKCSAELPNEGGASGVSTKERVQGNVPQEEEDDDMTFFFCDDVLRFCLNRKQGQKSFLAFWCVMRQQGVSLRRDGFFFMKKRVCFICFTQNGLVMWLYVDEKHSLGCVHFVFVRD
jgi:hypothetical protein